MKVKKKNNDDLNKDIIEKIVIVKKMIDNIFKILILFQPIIDKLKESDLFQEYRENGTIKKIATIFGEISEQSREIANFTISDLTEEFRESLKN
ncbi:MAG: hypothetical protein ACFFAH_08180 [Promethearchaeota archaeon]